MEKGLIIRLKEGGEHTMWDWYWFILEQLLALTYDDMFKCY